MNLTFAETTAVRRVDGGYEAELHPQWWVARGPHGGYLAAIAMRALMLEIDDPDRQPRSFTMHFLAAPTEGRVRLDVSIERSGRSMSFASARLTQDGKVMALVLAAFSATWDAPAFDDSKMPEVPAPDDAFAIPSEGPGIPRFLSNFDMRWAIGGAPFSGSERAELGGWFRLRQPETPDAPVVACYMDAWPPAIFPKMTERVVCPTIDLTIHFRMPLPVAGAGPDDLLLGRFWSEAMGDGLFDENGEMWTADGRLVAQSRQLAVAMRA